MNVITCTELEDKYGNIKSCSSQTNMTEFALVFVYSV